MSVSEQIFAICNQLKADGKTPTTAVIKAKLPVKVPLPEIIGILKQWQKSPTSTPNIKTSADENTSTISLEQRVIKLEKQVLELQQQLASLLK